MVSRLIFICQALLIAAPVATGQQLPLKPYTVAHGLGSNNVYHIYEDRKGFIWFATGEGLSLFDGHEFRNFDERDGLPTTATISVTEDDAGRIWVGTFDGISRHRMNDGTVGDGGAAFETIRIADGATVKDKVTNQIRRILFEPNGTMWILTDHGLFKSVNPQAPQPIFEAVVDRDMAWSNGAHRDADGTLWFGLGDELFEIKNSQATNRGSVGVKFPANFITSIARDRSGRLLVSDIAHVMEYRPASESATNGVFSRIFSIPTGKGLTDLAAAADGSIWIGADIGLFKRTGESSAEFRRIGDARANIVRALTSDRAGNLWISITNNGVRLLETESLLNFVPKDRGSSSVGDVIEDSNGRLWAALEGHVSASIENNDMVERAPDEALPAERSAWFGYDGRAWIYAVQNEGLTIQRPLLRLRSGRIIDVERFVDKKAFGSRFYEDKSGVLWMARADGKVYRGTVGPADELSFDPIVVETSFSYFASRIEGDGAGGIWLLHPMFIGRIRNGKYQSLSISGGLPEKEPRSVFTDSRGWLWIGLRNKGVSVTKSPSADDPHFENFSKANGGLRSNAIRSITEDRLGRMYFATDNGLSRFDIEKNEWSHFSSESGLAGDVVFGVIRDRDGFIWAATQSGLSRLDPGTEKTRAEAPSVFVTGVENSGAFVPLPVTGVTSIGPIEFRHDQNDLKITFVAPNSGDRTLQYQYRLGDDEWSSPKRERSVSFSDLTAGSYRFSVRAVTTDGATPVPAIVEFDIMPPFWRRAWFVGAVALTIVALIYLAYRARIRQLLMIERTRTRIATDLHDDIGTNLSKISLLSEIVRLQSDSPPETAQMLKIIGETSRESVGAMTDIVWAINPKNDSVADVARRMRRHAEEIFLDQNVEVTFVGSDEKPDLKLSMETRRELYLIFKEAINNAAKYSGCGAVKIEFRVDGRSLSLAIADDGRGFDPDSPGEGNGIANLRSRADRIGARLEVVSGAGRGTVVRVEMRL